jgi:hypothetical protein
MSSGSKCPNWADSGLLLETARRFSVSYNDFIGDEIGSLALCEKPTGD